MKSLHTGLFELKQSRSLGKQARGRSYHLLLRAGLGDGAVVCIMRGMFYDILCSLTQ